MLEIEIDVLNFGFMVMFCFCLVDFELKKLGLKFDEKLLGNLWLILLFLFFNSWFIVFIDGKFVLMYIFFKSK